MNVLIVTQYFWPESFRINDLAQGLVERGHKVTVLTGKPNYPEGKFYSGYHFFNKSQEYYGEICVIRSPLLPRGKNNKLKLAINYLSFVFFASIMSVIKCKRPDVIFVYEPSPVTVALPAIFYKKIKKVPILFWVQDLWPESVIAVGATQSKTILKWLEKLVGYIYTRCDYILTTSLAYFEPIKKFNVSDERLKYFPQTAESFYRPLPVNDEIDQLLPKGFRIIFSGNIGIAQDIETILSAAILLRKQKEIKWIFLGDGSKREWLQDEIQKNHLSETVHWLGRHPVESMPQFFSCADAFLVTLKKDPVFSLTIPAKIQSSLACAKPIIAGLDGEGKRIIEEAKAGMATYSGDSKGLSDIVLQMYNLSENERNVMGINGRKYFEKYFQREMLIKKLETWMIELKERCSKI